MEEECKKKRKEKESGRRQEREGVSTQGVSEDEEDRMPDEKRRKRSEKTARKCVGVYCLHVANPG